MEWRLLSILPVAIRLLKEVISKVFSNDVGLRSRAAAE